MEEESSRFKPGARKAWGIAAAVSIAVFGAGAAFAVSGCGSDDNSDSVNNAIDSIQSQASSVQSQISSAATNIQSQASSIATNVQSQAQSVQSQVQSQTQSNGGSGVP